MIRLIQKGLMFGNLVHVDSPALIERYNRALKALSGRQTALTDFYVDISGYSPEVGEELGDALYLNPNGCNRQFILLSTAQKSAPLLEAKFSNSRGILKRFITENEAALFALTTRDAVAGELENSVFDVSDPARLLDIRQITVEADTTQSHVARAAELTALIERFQTEPDAWWDDALIAEMIEMARDTGDVVANPVKLARLSQQMGNYWTAHFDGLYVFRDLKRPVVIASGALPAGLKGVRGLTMQDRNQIAEFLTENELVEPVVQARGLDAEQILSQKMDFILVDTAAGLGHDLGGGSRRELRQLAQKLGADLPEEFHALAALKRWAGAGGRWPKITSEHAGYFYTMRARAGKDRDLVNRLLAELAPLDIRQLFICHKELFYTRYRSWSDGKRGFVADFLHTEYQKDKAGVREALFGGEPGEVSEPKKRERRRQTRLEQVGPWGAVGRSRGRHR
jgi:uncharacterized protein DUF6638